MTDQDTTDAPETPSFADLGLSESLVAELASVGYERPTPIQQQAIPVLLGRRDLVGQAQTGTGKTAAFALPMLQRLNEAPQDAGPSVKGLVLAPTRELAMQVCQSVHGYSQGLKRRGRPLRVLAVYGGAPIGRQLNRLERGVDVVVGTPGRLMDCIRRGALDLSAVEVVVLDEADEMLRMGFIEDVTWILGHSPAERQTALFSATMPPEIRRVAAQYLTDPVTVAIEGSAKTVEDVEQRVICVPPREKFSALTRILEAASSDAVLVFARTQVGCAELAEELLAQGFEATALHGGMGQPQREDVIRRLESRRVNVVVATDVAARGLHVDGITHVINFDPPDEPETYVHRIGRTGRAGKKGMSVLLLTWRQRAHRLRIEHYTRKRMIEVDPPTDQDLAAGRVERFKNAVKERLALNEADLAVYRSVVTELVTECESDSVSIAAAVAHMACTGQPLQRIEPQRSVDHASAEPTEPATQRPSGADPVEGGDERPRLFVSLGAMHGVRPGDLVGAIANEAGVPGAAIGPIDIREKFSFVGIEAEFHDLVLQKMTTTKIRGRTANIKRATTPRGDTGPAPEDRQKYVKKRPPPKRGPKRPPKHHRKGNAPGSRAAGHQPPKRGTGGKRRG